MRFWICLFLGVLAIAFLAGYLGFGRVWMAIFCITAVLVAVVMRTIVMPAVDSINDGRVPFCSDGEGRDR